TGPRRAGPAGPRAASPPRRSISRPSALPGQGATIHHAGGRGGPHGPSPGFPPIASCAILLPHMSTPGRVSMPKRWTVLVALVVATLMAATVFVEAQAPIKLGVIQPLSGPVAASGNYVRMGAEIARDWLNAKGGINGRKVELVIEDNKSDPKEAASAAEMLKKRGVAVGAAEFMEQSATDMNAQLTKIKATGGDTLFLTTAVEQITLIMKQAQEQRLARRIVTTGGSSSPTQLIKQAGTAAEGTYHIVFFMPWFPEAMPDGKLAKAFVDEWAKRGHPFGGLTEGFRGHDGIATLAEAVKLAGQDDP